MRQTLLSTLLVLAIALGAAWIFRGEMMARFPELRDAARRAGVEAIFAPSEPKSEAKGGARPAVTVVTEAAARRDVPITMEAVGTAQSILSVAIKSRVDSQIETVNVQEGALVKAGDLLFTLDKRTIEAQIAQIDAQIARDSAQLEQAKRDVIRLQDLVQKNAGTGLNLENAETNTKVLTAQIAGNRANRDSLLTQLSFTEIRAPATGRLGTIQTKIGTVVRAADQTPLATINQVDPIYVQFALPQSALVDLRTALAAGPVSVSVSVGERTLKGEVAFIENNVDVTTGTISVKAKVANPDETLWPGAFARVQVTMGTDRNALVVSSAAVQLGIKGPYLFVARNGKAELKTVEVKRTSGPFTVVAGNIEQGDAIVVDGQLRLVDGAPLTVKAKTPAVAGQTAPRS